MYYPNPAKQSEIRHRAAKGSVIFTDHATEQCTKRRIEHDKVLDCLRTGTIEGEDWNTKHQDNTFRIAKNIDLNFKLIVVVALDQTHDIVVTAFRREKR